MLDTSQDTITIKNKNKKIKTLSDKFFVKGRDQDYTLFVMCLGTIVSWFLLTYLICCQIKPLAIQKHQLIKQIHH